MTLIILKSINVFEKYIFSFLLFFKYFTFRNNNVQFYFHIPSRIFKQNIFLEYSLWQGL